MKKGIFQKIFISAGLFFVLALSLVPIAILYGNEAQRNMVLFLCSLGSCAAGFAAIYREFPAVSYSRRQEAR